MGNTPVSSVSEKLKPRENAVAGPQTWDPTQYAQHARFVADLASAVVGMLNPKPGERILDLGCGDGHLTAQLAQGGCELFGIDSSVAQIAAAKALGLNAEVMDAGQLSFESEFDAVFSNATLHWIRPPRGVIDSVFRALKPGGRFVAEFGGAGCVQTIRSALYQGLIKRGINPEALDPWYFPTVEAYAQELQAGGFKVHSIEIVPRPTRLPSEMKNWLKTFALTFLAALPENDIPEFLEEVEAVLRPHLCDALGQWTADYTRLRFKALKPIEHENE